MALLEKSLLVKKSQLPKAGKGLYTKVAILKGTKIVEYKGRISVWKELEEKEWDNGYIFYVTRNHVINASPFKKALARYANDAAGIARVKGIRNNCKYNTQGKKVYIEATRDISAGAELFVGYGKEYWDAVRYNTSIHDSD